MFEFSFIRRILSPKRKQLSLSLIALLSVTVITLVVWLVILFLSVTEGIEKNWVNKLTAINGTLRLKPTEEYFSSYYYNVDKYSGASNYMAKTIGKKAASLMSDPYDPEVDVCLPFAVAPADRDENGRLKDPVKGVFGALARLEKEFGKLPASDVEMSGALLRLEMVRSKPSLIEPVVVSSQLTHASFLASLPQTNPHLNDLVMTPTMSDLDQLLRHPVGEEGLNTLLRSTEITELVTHGDVWKVPAGLLKDGQKIKVNPYEYKGEIAHVMIQDEGSSELEKRGDSLLIDGERISDLPLFIDRPLRFSVEAVEAGPHFLVRTELQETECIGWVPFDGLKVSSAKVGQGGPFPEFAKRATLPRIGDKIGVLLAKNMKESGARIGDQGYLGYSAPGLTGMSDQKIPIFVSGFYDPGVMSVGNKCVLVPNEVTEAINASSGAFALDRSESNAICVWTDDLKHIDKLKERLVQELEQRGLSRYWKVETYKDFPFAKDLMQQFSSDKYLFTLIGVLILLVACTNIISLLVILVSDRKKEIGVLRAMGARRRSIAMIFAFSGGFIGLCSTAMGIGLASLTLSHLDALVAFLSQIQGRDAFNPQFFGQSLPRELSSRALWFAGIATPVLAVIAGLVPAIKAARQNPCDTLRSE